jgi:hypothetical protein
MYVCMHTCMHACTFLNFDLPRLHTYSSVDVWVCMYVCTFVCVYALEFRSSWPAYMLNSIKVYVCVCVRVLCVYAYYQSHFCVLNRGAYSHTSVWQTHTHACMHACMHACVFVCERTHTLQAHVHRHLI